MVELRGISVGAATRVRGCPAADGLVNRSSAEAAIRSNGTRTVDNGTGRWLAIGMSLYPTREDAQAVAQTAQAQAKGTPGIYVYSLPHYVRHRFDPETGHTLFKVGRSDVDVFQRVGAQARTAALPEDPVLLRIYHAPGRAACCPTRNASSTNGSRRPTTHAARHSGAGVSGS